MGFFDALLGKPRREKETTRAPRGKGRPATEKLAREEALYLSHLRKTNPTKWAQIMEARLGVALAQPDAFTQLEDMVKKMKAIGLIKSAKDLADDGDSTVKDLLAAVAPVAAALIPVLQAQQAQRMAAAAEPKAAIAPAASAGSAPAVIEPAAAEVAAAEGQEPKMSLRARFVKNSLEKLDPPAAAAWLVGLENDEVNTLIDMVCKCPDEKLPALLMSLGQKAPEFAGLCWWLARRGDWLLQTAAALRELMKASTQETAYSL